MILIPESLQVRGITGLDNYSSNEIPAIVHLTIVMKTSTVLCWLFSVAFSINRLSMLAWNMTPLIVPVATVSHRAKRSTTSRNESS